MVLVASVVLASAFSFWSILLPRRSWQPWRGWDGSSSCVSLRLLFEEFPVLCVLAQFACGIWCIISVVLVSGSLCSGRLVVAEEFGKFDFSGDDCFRECTAWFDSGYMFCVSTLVAMDEFHAFSTLRQTRILKCPFPSVAERRSVPIRCFWLQFCSALFALGKLEVLLRVLRGCDA